jgi:hypothetical protein
MKRCPTCNRSYADDTLSFCLQDGAQLETTDDPEATVLAQPRPPVIQPVETPRESSNKFYQAIIVLLLLIVAGAGIGMYVMLSKRNEPVKIAASPSPQPSQADPLSLLNQNAQAKASPSPVATASVTPTPSDQPAIPKIYDKPYDTARKILIREGWLPNKRLPIHGEDVSVRNGNGPIFWKRGYWELEACSGTGLANCLFEFVDPTGRLLEVVTEGEEDEDGTYHARVSRVYLKKK